MNFFRHFTVKKTSFPLPAERLSCLYIEWFAYKYAIGGEDFWKIVSSYRNFLFSTTLLILIICNLTPINCYKKIDYLRGLIVFVSFVNKLGRSQNHFINSGFVFHQDLQTLENNKSII